MKENMPSENWNELIEEYLNVVAKKGNMKNNFIRLPRCIRLTVRESEILWTVPSTKNSVPD